MGTSSDSEWVVVLAKQPIAGYSKTRLARDIGIEWAQALAEAFVLDTLELVAQRLGRNLLVAYAPSDGGPWFADHAPGFERFAQPDASFGVRIQAAMAEAFRRGATRCVLIGMDTPHMESATLDAAFDALGDHDVCMGPSVDGGYYLIGSTQPQPQLFVDIPWSTETVHACTVERGHQAGLTLFDLEPELDVDEGADLQGLASMLLRRPEVAPRTRAAMQGLEQSKD